MERRRFGGVEVLARAVVAHPEALPDLITLLQGLMIDVFHENNHVTPVPDPEFPDRLSAPFDKAAFFFRLEEHGIVVNCLQITFWDDFVPN